jgi:PAS domain S-box-containing protein
MSTRRPPPPVTRLVLAVLLLAAAGQAQIHHVVTYNEQDGLPSAAIRDLAWSVEGDLLLATRSGLVAFDGLDWRPLVDEGPWREQPACCVAVDQAGRVWGASVWAPVRFGMREDGRWRGMGAGAGPPDDRVHTLLPRQTAQGEPMAAAISRGGVVALVFADTLRTVVPRESLGWVASAAWAGDALLLATESGLVRLSGLPDRPRIAAVAGVPAGPVYAVAASADAAAPFLVVGPTWLGELAGDRLDVQRMYPDLGFAFPERGVAVARDAAGGVYVADMGRVLYLHDALPAPQLLTAENGLAGGGATAMLADPSGAVWLASMRGLSKVIDRRFVAYDRRHGLLADEVSAVIERRDGGIVLGHGGGLTFMAPTPRTLSFGTENARESRVSDLLETPDGAIWIAASRRGLGRLGSGGDLRWLPGEPEPTRETYALAVDEAGHIWVGGAGGLVRGDGSTWEPVSLVRPGGDEPTVRRLQVLDGGAILVATTADGVFRIDGDGVARFTGATTHLNSTYGVFEAGANTLWVATGAGLAQLRDGRIVPTAEPGPVISRPIYAIRRADDGDVWFGTDAGVRVWDGERLHAYSARDGLLGAEVNRDALVLDRLGRMWVGTDRGVSVHDPRLLGEPPPAARVRIVDLEVGGRRVPLGEPLSLDADQNELVVHFRATPLDDTQALRFATYLEGLDAHWREPATMPGRSVRYTSLPPGRYRFHVRAVDRRGEVGPEATTPPIAIAAPLTERWWFVLLEFVAVAGLVFLLVALLHGRRYARRLSREVDERTAALAESEAAVRQESRRLEAVLASTSDAVLATDAEHRVVMANRSARELLAGGGSTLVGSELSGLLPGLDPAAATAPSGEGEVEGEREGEVVEYRLARPGNAAIELEVAVAPLADVEADRPGHVLAFRDVTDRRRLERERIRAQKLESLGVLAGGLAHDFNNLLTVVLGHVSMLQSGPAAAAGRASLDSIRQATEQARNLTGQLLTFARGGAPRKELTDLAALVRRAADLARAGAGVQLVLELPDDLPHAEVDPAQMEQVVGNLIINARQALRDQGRITIRGRATSVDGEPWVELEVVDDGPGIPREIVDRVFEPYFTTRPDGTGLGLPICHSILERHGGTIAVADDAGAGARFVIGLPAAGERTPHGGTDTGARADGVATLDRDRGLRVLVLDDEEPVRDILTRMLANLGHTTEAVAEGSAAIAAFELARASDRPFDLVIVDLTIAGGLGGRETFARLQAIDPQVRAIVASGYASNAVMSDHEGHGFRAALSKPFDQDALAAAIARAVADPPVRR